MQQGARKCVSPVAWVAGVSAVLLLVFPAGFPNYDTMYALVWGRELAEGRRPDYGTPLSPTPHPLVDLVGLITSPFGELPIVATMVLAYSSLGLIAYYVYRLGAIWFDRPIGAVACLIVLTRAPFLSNGLRAYIDISFVALCLSALLVEAKRLRTGWPVLALLVPAGLLRPEAWGFAIVYWLWLAFVLRHEPENGSEAAATTSLRRVAGALGWELCWRGERRTSQIAWLGLLAVAGPILWIGFDAITTGDPAYSLIATQKTVQSLDRKTGLVDLLLYGPRALGEVLQWPGLVSALGGAIFGIVLLRRRSALGIVSALIALFAFASLAAAGLAILARYTMLSAAILAIFAALALLGWRLLPHGDPWRRRWQLLAGLVFVMFLTWLPNQWDLNRRVATDLTNHARIEDALTNLVHEGVFQQPLCGRVATPNHRAVPRLAFDLKIKPSEIVSVGPKYSRSFGYLIVPMNSFVIDNFTLDPNDKTHIYRNPGAEFEEVARNHFWRVYSRC